MRACIVGSIFAWTAMSAVAMSQQREPYVAYRQLQDERDKAAFGAVAIDGELAKVVERFIASVNSAEVDWSDHRNANALVMFLLTGGEARQVGGDGFHCAGTGKTLGGDAGSVYAVAG